MSERYLLCSDRLYSIYFLECIGWLPVHLGSRTLDKVLVHKTGYQYTRLGTSTLDKVLVHWIGYQETRLVFTRLVTSPLYLDLVIKRRLTKKLKSLLAY